MTKPEDVLAFWLDELEPSDWYNGSEELDQKIRDKFLNAWQALCEGTYAMWLTYPSGVLAYIILADQFPRNMFRGSADAFKTDGLARAASKVAISRGWDLKIDPPARQFFYLPLRHSENQYDQDRSVRLSKERMPESSSDLIHARAHREIIRMFGRFPYRNEALGRDTTGPERAFIEKGGYRKIVEELQQQHAA